jgi:hypothetical protein
MNFRTIATLAALCASLAACGGDGSDPDTLSAGQSATIHSGQTLHVPSDTIIDPSGSHFTIMGHGNTITVAAGVVVAVQADASGAADNLVVAH